PPRRFEWNTHPLERMELEIDSGLRWHPALYIHGPFLAFLATNFAEGLETIARLVDFAAERLSANIEADARQQESEAQQGRADVGPIGRLLAERRRHLAGSVVLPLQTENRRLI